MPGKKFMRERAQRVPGLSYQLRSNDYLTGIRDRVLYVNANNSVSFKNNLYTTYLKSEEA